MSPIRIAAITAPFDRDIDACFDRIDVILNSARRDNVDLVVLPEGALGGYIDDPHSASAEKSPPALHPNGPEIKRLIGIADELIVCAGYCESAGRKRYNAAICVGQGKAWGHYRNVHQPPLSETTTYGAGDRFSAFDTPVGRLGMLIGWDKNFGEAARTLALQGSEIIACLSAWSSNPNNNDTRWAKKIDLFDQTRALENQIFWAASNQTSTSRTAEFIGSSKVIGPGGNILASAPADGGTATATIDVDAELDSHRQQTFHLADRRPETYQLGPWTPTAARLAATISW